MPHPLPGAVLVGQHDDAVVAVEVGDGPRGLVGDGWPLLPLPRSPPSATPSPLACPGRARLPATSSPLTIQTWTVFVQSLVGMTRDLFDGFAAAVRKVIGLPVDNDQQAGLCLGDPTAYV